MTDSDRSNAERITRLVDAKLRRGNGELLGMIDELLIDLRSGRIEYLLVLSMKGQRLKFPWSAIRVEHDGFVLNRSSPCLVVDSSLDPGR